MEAAARTGGSARVEAGRIRFSSNAGKRVINYIRIRGTIHADHRRLVDGQAGRQGGKTPRNQIGATRARVSRRSPIQGTMVRVPFSTWLGLKGDRDHAPRVEVERRATPERAFSANTTWNFTGWRPGC